MTNLIEARFLYTLESGLVKSSKPISLQGLANDDGETVISTHYGDFNCTVIDLRCTPEDVDSFVEKHLEVIEKEKGFIRIIHLNHGKVVSDIVNPCLNAPKRVNVSKEHVSTSYFEDEVIVVGRSKDDVVSADYSTTTR